MGLKNKHINSNMFYARRYLKNNITFIAFILISIILFLPSSINAQTIIDKKAPEKGYYILALPS